MLKICRLFVTLGLCGLLAACAQQPTLSEQPSSEFAAQGLYPVASSGFDSAYVRPDAGMPTYRVVAIASLDTADVEFVRTAVSGTTRRDWEMTAEREANLKSGWQRAMHRAFADYDQSGTGDRVLRITGALTRVAPGRSSTTRSGAGGSPTMSSGDSVDISVEFRLYDGASDDLLAVIRDTRTVGLAMWSRSANMDMVNLFNPWAGMLHTRVSGR